MSLPISVVIPSLIDRELLKLCLEPLIEETIARGVDDQILVVDDSGSGELAGWLAEAFPSVECLARERNGGFAVALGDGVRTARHERILALNPDVRVRPGCLAPLVETLADPTVHAVSPYVLLGGEAPAEETLPALVVEDGFPVLRSAAHEVQPGHAHPDFSVGIPVAFALGGAFLFRRADYLARPFDPRFEPFYWEDVDWGHAALRAGRRIVVDPRAVVEHHHRGTIGPRVPVALVRAAIEKNRLLFAWKHFEREGDRRAHLEALAARLVEHAVCEEREEIGWLLLALEQLEALEAEGES